MFGLGLPELLLILVIGLIFFGPGKLPEIGSALGKSMKEFKQAVNSTETEIKKAGEIAETAETKDAASAGAETVQAEAKKIALACGVLLAAPVLFYELWAFLVPALTGRERSALMLFVPSSVLLFWAGIAFAYFFVFPQGLHFFTTFAGGNIAPMLSIESYLDFFLMLVVPFGFIFNLPMVLIVLAQMGVVTSALLKRGRRYMVVASFILAAIITPTPDVVTQTLLAVPMILLYEGSRVFIKLVLRK